MHVVETEVVMGCRQRFPAASHQFIHTSIFVKVKVHESAVCLRAHGYRLLTQDSTLHTVRTSLLANGSDLEYVNH